MIKLHYETNNLILISFNKTIINEYESNYYNWFGDEDVTKYNSHGLFPKTQNELEDFFNKCENDNTLLVFAIIEKKTNKHIGIISLQKINYINRSAEFAIIIGEKDCWGKGYATEAAEKLFEHGFMRLGLHRIWSGTSILNEGMIKCFKKLNMIYEGIFRDAQFLRGDFYDIVLYSILSENYFLKKYDDCIDIIDRHFKKQQEIN